MLGAEKPTMEMTGKWFQRARQILAVSAVVVVGAALALQGWRSQPLNYDLVPFMDSTERLLKAGTLPDHGGLTSYASYIPPGTSWLFVPGMFLFHDPRLFEYPGSILLYVGTMAGIFVFAKKYISTGSAYLAVVLYGLSELGLRSAGSLWPRGVPTCYVWMIFFVTEWATRRNPKYLAAALITWSAGMYIFLEIAPAILIVPVVWFVWRPPLGPRWLLGTVLASFVLWLPYLRFEIPRGFADLRSQVFRVSLRPANPQSAWCYPSMLPENNMNQSEREASQNVGEHDLNRLHKYSRQAYTLVTEMGVRLLGNYHGPVLTALGEGRGQYRGMAWQGLILFLVGWIEVVAALPHRAQLGVQRWTMLPGRRQALLLLAAALLTGAVVFNEYVVAAFLTHHTLQAATRSDLRTVQILLVLVAGLLVWLVRRNDRYGSAPPLVDPWPGSSFLITCLAVPWFTLLVVVERGHSPRFWWLWPGQVLLLAAALSHLWKLLGKRAHLLAATVTVVFCALVVVNGEVVTRIKSGLALGWGGIDGPEVQVADHLASLARSENQERPRIGYQVFHQEFMRAFHEADSRYRIGADMDTLMWFRDGLKSANQCAEGLSPQDRYLVVQVHPTLSYNTELLPLRPADGAEQLISIGPYRIYKSNVVPAWVGTPPAK